jgi:hypothetical protein
VCGKDRCMYYGCNMCGWRLDAGHIEGGLAYLIRRDECDCLNDTFAELCSEACRDRYMADVLECTCGSKNVAVLSRGASTK